MIAQTDAFGAGSQRRDLHTKNIVLAIVAIINGLFEVFEQACLNKRLCTSNSRLAPFNNQQVLLKSVQTLYEKDHSYNFI